MKHYDNHKPVKKMGGGIRPKHSLGQNFITDEHLFEQLVDVSGVGENDAVLEIGPGAGGMTKVLAQRCRMVKALEIDTDLLPILRVALEPYKNAEVICGDVMKANLTEITKDMGECHVVANIPYYLTTPLLEMLLKGSFHPASINVMVQKEAADRIVALPGTSEYGMLAVRAQYAYEPRIALDVPAEFFTPKPKVDSAFVVMPKRETPAVTVSDEALFFKTAASAFLMRRKTLQNNLCAALGLTKEQAHDAVAASGFSESVRGETLSLADFALLSENIKKFLIN